MKTYKAMVKLPRLGLTEARVQAANAIYARSMLEAQYGKSNVFGVPTEVK